MSHARTKHSGKALFAGRSVRTQENACLDCGYVMDGATGIGHRRKPRPGSITICIRCGHVMAYDGDLKFRPLTDKEVHAIAGDEQIIAAQKVRTAYQNWKMAKDDPAKFRAEAERQAALLRGTQGEKDAMDFCEAVYDEEQAAAKARETQAPQRGGAQGLADPQTHGRSTQASEGKD